MRLIKKYLYASALLVLVFTVSTSIHYSTSSLIGQTRCLPRVYASEGVPVSGAFLVASSGVGYGYAVSGSDGSYEINKGLRTGVYDIHVTAFGYINQEIKDVSITEQSTTKQNIFLNCSGGISGTIRNAENTPLEGITVLAVSGDGQYFSNAVTDVSGEYLMATNLETGLYNVTTLFPIGYVSNSSTGVSVTRRVETKNVDITLSPSGIINGMVTGINGVPVANATVNAVCGDDPGYTGMGTTDIDGSYTINTGLGTGNYTVIAFKDTSLGIYGGVQPENVTLTMGETENNVDITITISPSPSGSISGRVTDLEERPIQGATVSASGTGSGSALTDEDGYYKVFGLTPGTYLVESSANGFQTQNKTSVEVVTYQNTPGVNFQLERLPPEQSGTLTGTVTGEVNPIPEFNLLTLIIILSGTGTVILLLKSLKSRSGVEVV